MKSTTSVDIHVTSPDSDTIKSDTTTYYTQISSTTSPRKHVKHPYILSVHLIKGTNLVVRDTNGFSDPYVKFKIGSKVLCKSKVKEKTLNPKWNENFEFKIKDVEHDLELRVYDRDMLSPSDDYMGHCFVNLAQLRLGNNEQFTIDLTDETGKALEPYMGSVYFSVKLNHRLIPEDLTEQFNPDGTSVDQNNDLVKLDATLTGDKNFNNLLPHFASKLSGKGHHNASVIIHLIEGSNLLPMDDNGLSDPYVKFVLGDQKYKSRVIKENLNPRWCEEFRLKMYSNCLNMLHITVFDHDVAGQNDFMGRTKVNLANYGWEKSHIVEAELLDGAGVITFHMTITGATLDNIVTDTYFSQRGREEIINKYSILNTIDDIRDVGWLQVKVFRAERLDEDSKKTDAYCILQLDNTRLETHTEHKTHYPNWERSFTFTVKDIHTSLDITVFDENKDKKYASKILGKVSIPLLRVCNSQKVWYGLKDRCLERPVTGRIELEIDVIYNPLRAAFATINPKEKKIFQPDEKFKLSKIKRNVNRFITVVDSLIDFGTFLDSCWRWENPARSLIAFICYMTIVWNFELYLLPFNLIIVLLMNLIYRQAETYFMTKIQNNQELGNDSPASMDIDLVGDISDDDMKNADEVVSWRERIKTVQTILVRVQVGLHNAASICEQIKHTFKWTVPWMSMFALILLIVGTVALYFVPLRYLLLLWGLNKFTKKILRPSALDNNELLDYLSHMPCDVDLEKTKEVKVTGTISAQGSPAKK